MDQKNFEDARVKLRTGYILCFTCHSLLLGYTGAESLQFGTSVWLWGVVVRTVVVWHITWSVNSLSHAFGYQNYDTGDYSRNNVLVAILASGEGWHNNHHAEPNSACNQRYWWEIDLTYWLLCLLVACRLAWDVQLPKRAPGT